MKIKIIVGFRKDQEYSIDAEEAHKAYFLFTHPAARGVFKNGLGIIGEDIKGITPDWHGTMGWNPSHNMDGSDWNDIRSGGYETKMNALLSAASAIAKIASPDELNVPLLELVATKYPQIAEPRRERGTRQIGDIVARQG